MRSLHMRLVLILIVLILSLMAVVGYFLIDSVALFYRDEFAREMRETISDNHDFVQALVVNSGGSNPAESMKKVVDAYAAPLGLNGSQRRFYILEGRTGRRLDGDELEEGKSIALTSTIYKAMQMREEPVGVLSTSAREDYFDCAVPISSGDNFFILYIIDSKQSLKRLTSDLFTIVLQAVLFGLVISILLSFFLSKTMSLPIENLTRSAARVASGDFTHLPEVRSQDEIGVLTKTFNDMSRVLKETIETVENERDKLGTLFLHMTDGVASFTHDGVLAHMNPAAISLLSLEQAEGTEGTTYDDILGQIAPLDEIQALRPPEFAERGVPVGGKTLQILFAPFGADTGESGIIAVIRDVTEQQRLDKLRREFVSNVSHELRTPLTNVKSYAETLLDASDLPHDTIEGFAQVIVNEADRMTRLVRDLLVLSRFDYGRVEWNWARFSFERTLRKIYETMLMEASRHGHEMTLSIQEGLPDMTGDSSRIEQVLVNIISNAIAYTQDGGRIDISAGRVADEIWCKVRDNGPGIPKNDIPHLFERFYRVEKARSRESGGTGLGLAIAQEIVKGHGGYISVASQVGQGTTFMVTLPVNPPRSEGGQ